MDRISKLVVNSLLLTMLLGVLALPATSVGLLGQKNTVLKLENTDVLGTKTGTELSKETSQTSQTTQTSATRH